MSVDGWQPPQGVPTLTEVVSWPETAAAGLDAMPSATKESRPLEDATPASHTLPPPELGLTQEQWVQRVLDDVQRQVDLMLEYRLREVLTPMLARLGDSVVREARAELASTLRDVVARAVEQELARHRMR